MTRIWKYVLDPDNLEQRFWMPARARVLTVGIAGGRPCLWALHDVENEKDQTTRRFLVVMTGQEFEESARVCTECFTRQFGKLDWTCPNHPGKTVDQDDNPYFGQRMRLATEEEIATMQGKSPEPEEKTDG
ncbi:MAG: hypothetical protein LC798_12935 [Chloroflexi bacterium]|nr:hypothetical protein [Chloroflexota bacterium]